MSAFRATYFALALGLLFLIPVVPTQNASTQTPTTVPVGETAVVRIQIAGTQAGSLASDVQIVEVYKTFVIARAGADAITRLAARGLTVTPEDTYSLHVNGYAFDTRTGVSVPDVLSTSGKIQGAAYHLVQFIGPVKEEWKWAVEGTGAKVVAYTANNVYVVRATAANLAAIRGLPEVQWTGYYEPAFRISPDLITAQGTVVVDIVVFDGEPVNAVVASLNKMGLRVVGHFSPEAGILDYGAYTGFGLVRARLDASQLIPIAQLRTVRFIQPHLQMQLASFPEQWVLQSNTSTDLGPGSRPIFQQGIRGEGQTIAVSDTGLDYDHSMFRHSQNTVTIGSDTTSIYNQTNFARRKVVRYLTMSQYVGVEPWQEYAAGNPDAVQDSPIGFCGSGHGTSTSGSAAGDDTGISPASLEDGTAPNAKLIMMDIGAVDQIGCGDTLSYIPNDYTQMFGAGFAAGARIFSNSWGAQSSAYTLEASMVDRFMWNNPDALILFANGNNPPSALVGSPATAKNLISVSGATAYTSRETMSGTSRGPTTDGRRKPDISTFFQTSGTSTTALSDGDLTTLNSGSTGFSGTSYSTPLAAGMAALARQYFTAGWYPRGQSGGLAIFPSGALLKAVLAASSVPMGSTSACPGSDLKYPNIAQGWGRLWLDEGLYFSGDTKKLFVADNRQGITTGDTITYKVRLASPAGRFRAFLAYSDAPAIENANPALVNNLDLDVTDPGGTEYKGNVQGTCASGQTIGGGSFDTLNNLEGVVRRNPAAGEWTIRVIGANVPMGPQRYGLVILGDLDRSYGLLELDKTVYSESDTIQMTVTDSDATAVSVTLSSDTEPAGETSSLPQAGPGWQIFRNSTRTDYGVPQPDGKLQVSCGDTITATYNDVSPPHASVVTARVDCDYPVISNVRVIGITNSAATVTWNTDRPADSTVFYGTTPALGSSASDSAFTTSHAVPLNNLNTSTLYYFDVQSSRFGHTTRDSNRGLHYTFKTGEKAEILLVIGDASYSAERISMERDALSSASWTWNEWSVATAGGDPPLATLQSYKAVLWEVGLEEYPPIPDATAALLKTFVDNGGRLYVGGHDIAWAACDPGSVFNTLSRCNFVKSILKYFYFTDPQTVTGLRGVAGDQISGTYTAGLTYVQHRTGGATDQGNLITLGGTTTYVWTTTTGDVPANAGVKWVSGANNGSANPGCVFCGSPSRIAFFAFEFTGINYVPGVFNNAARTDIMDKTIIFLIGRSPPTVQVGAPNGGEIISADFMLTWSHSAGLASQDIWRSQDFGQSWFTLQTGLPGGDISALIDISSVAQWPDGNGYLMRVVVTDAGTPPFSAQDSSDSNFTIRRPGGDVVGPVVLAGSLRVSPNPLVQGQPVTITATVDDTLTGNSNINAAEYFVQAAMPTPADYGNGTAMSAVNVFDSPTEAVMATMPVTSPVGTVLTIWVHGRDAALPTNNWGMFGGGNSTVGSLLVLVIPGGGSAPNAPTGVNAQLVGAAFANVQVSWQIPAGPPISKFQVYFATTYNAAQTGYSLLQDNIAATATTWDHINGGSGDANNYFYAVCAVNSGGRTCGSEQAAKFTRSLTNAGPNIVSIPLVLQDTSVLTALQTLSWRSARTFVAGAADEWRAAYARGNGDLRTVSTGMALWVDIVSPKDFTIAGQVPTNTTLALQVGWNFVGYSGFIPANANAAASFAGLGLTRLEGWIASPQYYLQNLTPATTTLEPGKGYWVYLTVQGSWTVSN